MEWLKNKNVIGMKQCQATAVAIFCSDAYPSIGLIRSLGEAGYRPECYCYGNNCRYLLSSKYVSSGRMFKSAVDVLDFLINDYPNYDIKPILFTVPDLPAFLVDQHQNSLKDKFVLMSAGEQGNIGYWMDKRNLASIAKKHGLTIPWIIELSKNEDIPESIQYPVFTKSIKTVDGGKNDESICWNKEELENLKLSISSDKFLVMQYIHKKLEICYFGISLKGKVYIDYHDEISRFPDGAYGYYNIFKKCENDDTYRKCISMMEDIGYEGLFDIEFLLGEDNVLYFMEINFRVDGAIYKVTPGVNLPAEWCRLINVNKGDLPATLPTKKDYFTGMTEVHDFKMSVMTGKINFFKWLWQFCFTDSHMLINLKDPKPAFMWLYCFILNNVKK